MKVSELVSLLQSMPADARVIVRGYEGGFDDVMGVVAKSIIANGGYRAVGGREGWGGPYCPRLEGMEGEHIEAAAGQRADPDFEGAVFLESNRAR
jgi:hypothetical protein